LHVISPTDQHAFILISIEDVVKTLFEAIGLVCACHAAVLWQKPAPRPLIPTIAVPVCCCTVGVLKAFRLTRSMCDMFSMCCDGLLVDDASWCVKRRASVDGENRPPKEATLLDASDHSCLKDGGSGIAWFLSGRCSCHGIFGGSTVHLDRQFSR